MRLIGTFATEKEAYNFYSFLLKEKIQNIYERATEEKGGKKEFRIWIYDENDLEAAQKWLSLYHAHPADPRFQMPPPPVASVPPPPAYAEISEREDQKWQSVPPSRFKMHRPSFFLTRLLILLCVVLFLWDEKEEMQLSQAKGPLAVELTMTPIQGQLLFDDPVAQHYLTELVDQVPLKDYTELNQLPPEATSLLKKADETPSWHGLLDFFKVWRKAGWQTAKQIPLFEKIREGELWRLFTPCLLHRDFLHILFNMVWAWMLLRQLESRLPRLKICLLILILGVLSNLAQYLISGPYFLGFSGVIVGLASFLWMRQKLAPWEGYTLQRSTALFLLIFVLAMFFIEILSFTLQSLSLIQVAPRIANTAHIVGGLVGFLLGRLPLFSRRAP